MTTRFPSAPALLLLLAGGCAATPEPVAVAPPRPQPEVVGGQRLSGPEFRQLVFGNTLDRQLPNGARLLMHVAADGEQRLRIVGTNGQRATDRGRLDINGDEICTRWERIDAGRQNCFAYFRLGGSLVAIEMTGAMSPTRFDLLQGNPEGL